MKYSNIVSSIAVLIASAAVVPIDEWLSSFILNSVISFAFAVIISSVFAIFVEILFNYLPKTSRHLRGIIYPMAQYEGIWIQIHDNTKEIAICNIEFDKKNEDYTFSGKHYTNSGFVVSFTSNTLHYDDKINGFDYLVQGQHDDGEFVKCWGYITFSSFKGIEKNIIMGKGSFVEIGSYLSQIKFTLFRPSKELIKRLKRSEANNYPKIINEYFESSTEI